MIRRGGIAGLVVLGVLVFAIALLATVPAARVIDWVDPPGVRVEGVQGRAWAGSAQRVEWRDEPGMPPLTAVTWDVAVWRLLTGQLHADVTAEATGLEAQGRIAITPARALLLRGLTLRGPVDGLAAQAAVPVAATGRLLASIEHARIEAGIPRSIRGRAVWSDAALAAPVGVALGDVVVDFEPGDGTQLATIEASGGELLVEGTVVLDADGGYRVDLTLVPTGGASRRLRDVLLLVAREDGAGRYRIRQSGRLQ